MPDEQTHAELRELADAVRDLGSAMHIGLVSREEQGKALLSLVSAHHMSTAKDIAKMELAIDRLRTSKDGAPYTLVYVLILAIFVQAGVVLHLYGQSRGHDATSAFRDVTDAAEMVQPDKGGVPR
jgi:hypothetical protein